MKKRVYLVLAVFLAWASTLVAQDVLAGLSNAFKQGSSKELAPYMGDKVEYIYKGTSRTYNKFSAEQAMSGFFMANKVTNFTLNHEGKRNESGFIVGTLATVGGNYRINCFFKKVNDQYLIHQIRIDKSNE